MQFSQPYILFLRLKYSFPYFVLLDYQSVLFPSSERPSFANSLLLYSSPFTLLPSEQVKRVDIGNIDDEQGKQIVF
jgi:hypothetical protein